jgi:hypothetical protein
MGQYNIVNAPSMVAGQPEDISQVLANFQAIQTILNGGIDDINIRPTAAIQPAKLAGYPSDPTKFLRGDSTWSPLNLQVLWDSQDAGVVFPNGSITTPSLPQTFRHLLIAWRARSNYGGTGDSLGVRINGISSAAYYWQRVMGRGATASATEGIGTTFTTLGDVACAGGGANTGAGGFIFIPYYAQTPNYYMVFVGLSGNPFNTTTGNLLAAMYYGAYAAGIAINTLTFLSFNGGSFVANSRFSVYGMG